MKTRISQLVALLFFALLMVVGNVNAKGTEKSASSHENIEVTLELEDWMLSEDFGNTGNKVTIESTNDEMLELEEWMTNEQTWIFDETFTLNEEKEETLVYEPWMTNENIWNR